MSGMNEEPDKPWVGLWRIAALVLAFLALYPLSYGPSIWLVRRGWLPPNATIAFYAPMPWLHESGPWPIREWVRWYANLCQ